MHSRIFQLSKKPLDKDNYIHESYFYDDFVGAIADYVDGETDRDQDIKWLLSTLGGLPYSYGKTDQSIIFHENFKLEFFRSRLDELKEKVVEHKLEDFAGLNGIDGYMEVHKIEKLLTDDRGFYVIETDVDSYVHSLDPMDNFIRFLEPEKKYYIGATIDYHY